LVYTETISVRGMSSTSNETVVSLIKQCSWFGELAPTILDGITDYSTTYSQWEMASLLNACERVVESLTEHRGEAK